MYFPSTSQLLIALSIKITSSSATLPAVCIIQDKHPCKTRYKIRDFDWEFYPN